MDDLWALVEAPQADEAAPVAEEDWRENAWWRVWGVRTPRLDQIPREHWREALITCSEAARTNAVFDHYLTREQRGRRARVTIDEARRERVPSEG
jgi:hypothetical protein